MWKKYKARTEEGMRREGKAYEIGKHALHKPSLNSDLIKSGRQRGVGMLIRKLIERYKRPRKQTRKTSELWS